MVGGGRAMRVMEPPKAPTPPGPAWTASAALVDAPWRCARAALSSSNCAYRASGGGPPSLRRATIAPRSSSSCATIAAAWSPTAPGPGRGSKKAGRASLPLPLCATSRSASGWLSWPASTSRSGTPPVTLSSPLNRLGTQSILWGRPARGACAPSGCLPLGSHDSLP